jgi:hypothetical protein
MGVALGLTKMDIVRLLPEAMQERVAMLAQLPKVSTLEPRLLERLRLRSAGIHGCRH